MGSNLTNPVKIDHLVIGAGNLDQGVAYVKEHLGVDIPFGGVHTTMGTHNHLMRLGDDVFLEVIAVNPDLPPLGHPRWFGLDDPYVRQQIEKRPALLTWVVRTRDIHQLLGTHRSFSFGTPEKIRRGNLAWYFGLPDDGRLFASGMLPYVMQWLTHVHPAGQMADPGCRLQYIEIYHPRAKWLGRVLDSIGVASLVRLHALPEQSLPYMMATIDTPKGMKLLGSSEASMPPPA